MVAPIVRKQYWIVPLLGCEEITTTTTTKTMISFCKIQFGGTLKIQSPKTKLVNSCIQFLFSAKNLFFLYSKKNVNWVYAVCDRDNISFSQLYLKFFSFFFLRKPIQTWYHHNPGTARIPLGSDQGLERTPEIKCSWRRRCRRCLQCSEFCL